MTRGYPDYTRNVGLNAEGNFQVGLTSAPEWFADNMEGATLKWVQGFGTVAFTTVAAAAGAESEVFSGVQALKITSAAGGSGLASRRFGGLPETGRIACQAIFKLVVDADFEDSNDSAEILHLSYRTGTQLKSAMLAYNPRNGKWYLRDTLTTRVFLGTYKIQEDDWHVARMEIDPATNKYTDIRVDNKIFDPDGQAFHVAADTDPANTLISFRNNADTGDNAITIIDDVQVFYRES